MKNISTKIIVSSAIGTLLFAAVAVLPAAAEVSTSGGLNINATAITKAQVTVNTKLTKLITKSDADVSARITALNNLNVRVQALKNVNADAKAAILANVNTNISGLTALKAKIDADTDTTVATTDSKSIFGAFRIYALVIPQGYIAASSDRVDTVVDLMNTISAKLQTRITADGAAGRNVTALQTTLTDLNTKIADAKIQADLAASAVAVLTPDQGDKTKQASNTAALKAARAKIKIATGDLETARKDAKSIIAGLKVNAKASTSTTTTTSTTVTQ